MSKRPPPKWRLPPTAGTTTGRFSSDTYLFTALGVPTLTSEPTLAEQGLHTSLDRRTAEIRDEYNARMNMILNKAVALPTPNPFTNQDEPMESYTDPYLDKHRAEQRAAKGFVHPSQHTLRTWAQASILPVIEMPLQGVAWHSPKTQEPGGSHSTPGLTLRSTRVHGDLFFAIADGVDSPVQVQFRIPMAALVTMLVRYQSLGDKPGGYMMYLTEDGELRFPTSDETLAGGPAPSDSNKD